MFFLFLSLTWHCFWAHASIFFIQTGSESTNVYKKKQLVYQVKIIF